MEKGNYYYKTFSYSWNNSSNIFTIMSKTNQCYYVKRFHSLVMIKKQLEKVDVVNLNEFNHKLSPEI